MVESLARYTELMVLRKTHGASAIPPVLATELDRYLHGRAQEAEVPLYQVGQQSWWKQTVLYDLSVESVSYTAADDGHYRVTVEVADDKEVVNGGKARPLEMDEDLDIVLFAEHPNSASGFDSVFYESKHRVSGTTTLTFVVDQRPGYAMIDPYLRRIDRNQVDNMVRVEKVDRPSSR